jgi:triosephosphate isomerase
MDRKPLIAGNWKMFKTLPEALTLASDLRRKLSPLRGCDLMVAPPYPVLAAVAERLEGSNVALGAQELFYETQGAFTGAVSGPMLRAVGCHFVLVGHSERRQLFGETLESSGRRVQAALAAELTPVLCIGETLQERQANRTLEVVAEQLDAGLAPLAADALSKLVIAYEPVWAIGTGQVATPLQAQEVHAAIRERLRTRDAAVASGMRILYGGSVKPDNAAEILKQPDIDGALVGGASLDAEAFSAIARASVA